jgi:signal transduction histidine kinase/ActR/RegA family two-component response regulator
VRSRDSNSAIQAQARPRRLARWWLDRSVRAKGLIVVAVPLIALMATTLASLVLQANERQERGIAIAASSLSKAASQVMADAVNSETGVRGYVATGDPVILAPYQATLPRIGADQKALRAAAAAEGDSGQQRAVDASIRRVFAELAQLRLAVSRGATGTTLRPAMLSAKTAMDLLRSQVADLVSIPTLLQAAQHVKISRLETEIDQLNLGALVLGMLAGLAGVALFTSGISRRVVAAAANADRLGEGQPLEPVGHCGDDLGRLADALVRAEDLLVSRAAELTAARNMALKATQAKNAFLSSTSHELRTPLNSILGFTQLLEMADLSDEDHDSVQRILGAGRHLLALINELIDIARIESGELSLSLEPVSVLPLIEEASTLMGPLAAERSITIVHRGVHPGLAFRADRQRFSQVLVNLISNAVKYNRRGGTITITCQAESASLACVVISDTGQGLSSEDLKRIFIPFERLGAEQTGIEGTGIGLPLARTLTEAMGGRLSASSVLGEGSSFTVRLPRMPDLVHVPPPSPARTTRARPSTAAGGSLSILYIEDNPANVEVVTRFLKGRPNSRLRSVMSGRAGLACAISDVPDIILLDLHLPDIHGDQVLKELKAEPITAGIPVIVLSADATPRAIRRLRASGALNYLTKPLDLAALGELLDSFGISARGDQVRAPMRVTPT